MTTLQEAIIHILEEEGFGSDLDPFEVAVGCMTIGLTAEWVNEVTGFDFTDDEVVTAVETLL